MSEYMHFASRPVVLDGRTYEQQEPRTFGKPRGFWFSVTGEDDWPTYCLSEYNGMSPESRLRFAHRVNLTPNADVLMVTTVEEMADFHAAFSTETVCHRRMHALCDSGPIDWRLVAECYDGLVIAPYQWSQRMDADWYYTWDCASGVVWNPRAVESVERVHLPALAAVAS